MRGPLSTKPTGGLLLLLLGLLSLVTPLVNANAGPPRALFLRLPADLPEPTVALAAQSAPGGGWSLTITTEGFRFTGLCVAAAETRPVGHAHVFLDGVKIGSAYAPIFDLGHLPAGRHSLGVVLRGQDHRALVGRDGLIEAKLTLTVPGPAPPRA